jgi:hypothetical protein
MLVPIVLVIHPILLAESRRFGRKEGIAAKSAKIHEKLRDQTHGNRDYRHKLAFEFLAALAASYLALFCSFCAFCGYFGFILAPLGFNPVLLF